MLVASRIDGARARATTPPAGSSPRVASLLGDTWRVALVVAPPGRGKTAAVVDWARRTSFPVVWTDLSDGPHDRAARWRAVAERIRAATDAAGPAPPLRARPERDATVADVVAGLADERRDGSTVAVVFDRADAVDDPAFWVDLAALVDGAAGGLRTVVIARAPAAIPAGHWRAAGRLLEIGPADLEAGDDVFAEPTTRRLERILRGIDPDHRRAARALAVPASFDPALAAAIAGPGAGDAALALTRRGLLEPFDDGSERRRFDPTLRALLVDELRREDSVEHQRLRYETARHLAAAGDLSAAYRELIAGDDDAEGPLPGRLVLALAGSADGAGVDGALGALPPPSGVDEPRLALAIADACLDAGRVTMADVWTARADELTVPGDAALTRRRCLGRARLSLLHGQLHEAEVELAALAGPDGSAPGPPAGRLATAAVAAKVALGLGQAARARLLLAAVADDGSPAAVELDALRAWCDVLDGDVAAASRRLAPVLDGVGQRPERPDQGLLETMITGAWAAYLGGEMATASRYAALALADADRLRWDWNLLRGGAVAVAALLHLGGPTPARSLLVETRLRRHRPTSPLDHGLAEVEVSILRALGRRDDAWAAVERMDDTPAARVSRASLSIERSGHVDPADLLDERDTWPAPQRIVATALSSLSDPPRLAAAVQEARRLGLVTPLTGHGRAVDVALQSLPLHRVHPRLAELLEAPNGSVPALPRPGVDVLTPRERTVLALLPSHLTYDQIAERLSLSVNTVKSNLKSIYRKLSVASRSDAVDTARAARLV